MAMIDEGKLQGNIMQILDLLKKESVCCSIVSAQWMCDADSGTAVWVTINEAGAMIVYDAPGGNVITPVGPLGPVDSSGNCPTPPFVPAITAFTVSQDACKALDNEQYITIGFTTNIPVGAYQIQAFIAGVWTDIYPVFLFAAGVYLQTDLQIQPYQNFEGNFALRVVEVNTGTIGGPGVEEFVTCVP